MKTEEELVSHLKRYGVLRSKNLISAFMHIDRADFIRPEYFEEAYEDYPLPIGQGQTISQPYTVAFMLEALHLHPSDSVLDIGSGSGWTTALIAHCAKEVVGIERLDDLVRFGRRNLERYNLSNASIIRAGSELGIPGRTFDKILVSAAARTLPESLLSQLRNGGRLVIPVEHAIVVVAKDDQGMISQSFFEGFNFVPLI